MQAVPPVTHHARTTHCCIHNYLAGGADANEVLNSRAVAVMQRMSDKLMGRDYAAEGGAGAGGAVESDSVPAQVRLCWACGGSFSLECCRAWASGAVGTMAAAGHASLHRWSACLFSRRPSASFHLLAS